MTPHRDSAFLADVVEGCPEGTRICVRVLPRSSQNGCAGVQNGALRVKLTTPPLEGRANEACCKLLAKLAGVPKSRVSILRGKTSRNKTLLISGLQPDAVTELLEQHCA
jgi:hypothetical protein